MFQCPDSIGKRRVRCHKPAAVTQGSAVIRKTLEKTRRGIRVMAQLAHPVGRNMVRRQLELA